MFLGSLNLAYASCNKLCCQCQDASTSTAQHAAPAVLALHSQQDSVTRAPSKRAGDTCLWRNFQVAAESQDLAVAGELLQHGVVAAVMGRSGEAAKGAGRVASWSCFSDCSKHDKYVCFNVGHL